LLEHFGKTFPRRRLFLKMLIYELFKKENIVLIIRYRATIKRGRLLDAIALIKQMASFSESNPTKRITSHPIGNNDILSFDIECEDMAAVNTIYAPETNPEIYKSLSPWMEMTTAVENELLLVHD
jgi:hypothetical protein